MNNINKSFVSQDVQDFLIENGWIKKYDSFHEIAKNNMYKNGIIGSQSWYYENDIDIEIHISYEDDLKHTCELWRNDNDCEIFKLRSIKFILKRRGLIK